MDRQDDFAVRRQVQSKQLSERSSQAVACAIGFRKSHRLIRCRPSRSRSRRGRGFDRLGQLPLENRQKELEQFFSNFAVRILEAFVNHWETVASERCVFQDVRSLFRDYPIKAADGIRPSSSFERRGSGSCIGWCTRWRCFCPTSDAFDKLFVIIGF